MCLHGIMICLHGRREMSMAQKFQRVDDSSEQNEEGATRGPKSTIAFPFGDLGMAIGVARTIWTNSGRHQCAIHQLSSWLGHDSLSSGAFRLKFTTARIFGLIEVNGDQVILTKLGRDILDPNLERQARTESFLQVPLFKELYEKHKGYTLPSDIGLEREIEGLGVTPNPKDKTRQAFQRSALQAGFFEQGRNKLVLPSGLETISAD